jgi:hypothetical protein
MTIMIKPLNQRDRKFVHELAGGVYLDGECYAFAIALHRGLGFPMVGLVQDDGVVRHAAAYSSLNHKIYDVRGAHEQDSEEFGRLFGFAPPYNLEQVTEERLLKQRLVHERSIEKAAEFAEMLWPELPWQNSFADRVKAWAEDIEKISRKHGVFFRSPLPTMRPIVSRMLGDEAGFVIEYGPQPGMFMIDRMLKGYEPDRDH